MSTPTATPAPAYTASKRLRIAARVTAALVSLQLVLIIGNIIGYTNLAAWHGMAGYVSLASAIVTMLFALMERVRGLGRAETLLAVILPLLMCIQLFLSTVDVRGPHMFLGGLIIFDAWVVAALVGGTPRKIATSEISQTTQATPAT